MKRTTTTTFLLLTLLLAACSEHPITNHTGFTCKLLDGEENYVLVYEPDSLGFRTPEALGDVSGMSLIEAKEVFEHVCGHALRLNNYAQMRKEARQVYHETK